MVMSVPRSLRLVALSSIVLAAIATACSDSSSSGDVTPTTDGGGDGSSSGDSSTGFDGGGGSDSSSTQDTGSLVDSNPGPQRDAGAPITIDAGDAGSIPCVVNGTVEVEPNNAAGTATEMAAPTAGSSSICGILAGGGDAAADVDFVKFKLQAATTSFYVEWVGNVTPEFKINGTLTTIGAAGSFQKTDFYSVEMKPNAGAAANSPWRLTVYETQ